MGNFKDGYYDDEGNWQSTKFCFQYCGDSCTCQPPFGAYYSKEHDKRLKENETKQGVSHE